MEHIKIDPKELLAKIGTLEIKSDGGNCEDTRIYIDGKFADGVKSIMIYIDCDGNKKIDLGVYSHFKLKEIDGGDE